MSRWVGVARGDDRIKYVIGPYKVLTDSVEEATRFTSREDALEFARQTVQEERVRREPGDWKRMYGWVEEYDAQEVPSRYLPVGYDATGAKYYLKHNRDRVQEAKEAAFFYSREDAMHFVNQLVNTNWSNPGSEDKDGPRPPKITHGGVEEV